LTGKSENLFPAARTRGLILADGYVSTLSLRERELSLEKKVFKGKEMRRYDKRERRADRSSRKEQLAKPPSQPVNSRVKEKKEEEGVQKKIEEGGKNATEAKKIPGKSEGNLVIASNASALTRQWPGRSGSGRKW